ncbi:Dual specificity protein kinase Ttklike [Caligus rogercresseyi]|uniref:Dual specificity protein kinase Ttklike n=1 Tax=Caligus rogercresseyi TaxID=217165 RepID=A0A7T8KLD1_CALRO|nr:Dual specificity protein kinase Ttklike [Caligus rogercresseyi]
MSGNDSEVKRSFLNEIKVLEKLQGNARVIKMYDYEYRKSRGSSLLSWKKGKRTWGPFCEIRSRTLKSSSTGRKC